MLSSKKEASVYLGAFGKHPGWNDHIDDLGLDTDDLVNAKRLLYAQGINQNIDAAAWEKLEPIQRLDLFRHEFLWYMPAGVGGAERSLIAGKMWSSVDGKGRDKYPMVVCVDTHGLPDRFAVDFALPFLAKTREKCLETKEAAKVVQIMDSDRAALREKLKEQLPPDVFPPPQIASVARHPDMLASNEGFDRIVYQMTKGMTVYRPGSTSSGITRRSEQMRVPCAGLKSTDALLFWLRFSHTLLDPTAPILLIAPETGTAGVTGSGWVDIIIGEPTASNLFCIKASAKSIPLTSEIPYTLDAGFTGAIDKFLDACAAADRGGAVPAWPAL